MRPHHDKPHGGYVAGLDAARDETARSDRPVEEVLADREALPEDKRTRYTPATGGDA